MARENEEKKPPRTIRLATAIAGWTGAAVVGVLASAFLGPPISSLLSKDPTVVEQLDGISRRAAAHHAHVRIFPGQFRGPGRRSYLVISSDTSFWKGRHIPRSDRVQIYDTTGGGGRAALSKRLDFTPARGSHGMLPWLFVLDSIRDIDSDGQPEIIGQFRERTRAHPARVPGLIRWDATTDSYTVRALVTSPPSLRRAPSRDGASAYQDLYRDRIAVADPRAGISITGYGARQTAIDTSPGGLPAVIGAYPSRTTRGRRPYDYIELVGFQLDLDHPDIETFQCIGDGFGRRIIVPMPWGPISSTAILSAWKRHGGIC
jgi:hypothetical protein